MARLKKDDGVSDPVAAPSGVTISQKRAQDAKAKFESDKESRKQAVLAEARELAKGYGALILPHVDRDGSIVPAIVIGTEDRPKRDSGGRVIMQDNQQVLECVLNVFIVSKIDVPHSGYYNKGE